MNGKGASGPKKQQIHESLRNGSVKIPQGFPSNSPQGFMKRRQAQMTENVPVARVYREGPQRTKSEKNCISLYSQQKYNKYTQKRDPPGSSQEAPGGTLWHQKGVREGILRNGPPEGPPGTPKDPPRTPKSRFSPSQFGNHWNLSTWLSMNITVSIRISSGLQGHQSAWVT